MDGNQREYFWYRISAEPGSLVEWFNTDPRTKKSLVPVQSGHMPGLWAGSPVWDVQETAD